MYIVHLKEFLKLLKCLASDDIHTFFEWLDSLFKALRRERKRKKKENSHDAYMGTSSCCRSPPISKHLVRGF